MDNEPNWDTFPLKLALPLYLWWMTVQILKKNLFSSSPDESGDQ